MMDRLLCKPKEAAVTIAVSRSVVYELMAAGELESVTIGRSRRIPVDSLRAFVEKRRQAEELRSAEVIN